MVVITKKESSWYTFSFITIHSCIGTMNDGMNQIIMEYCDGGSALDVLKTKRQLTEDEICAIIAQTVSALYYLHQNRILHRDVKV
jgi:serine/threonine protein kinase